MPQGAPPAGVSGGVAGPGDGTMPSGTRVGGFGGGGTTSKALAAHLSKDASRYTWIVATGSSQSAAPIQLATGRPVMALGGFTGSDDAITLARFEQLVAAGRIHYYIASGRGGGPGGGGSSDITSWVARTFTSTTIGGTTVYDLTSPRASG